jgi:hypothetical protein
MKGFMMRRFILAAPLLALAACAPGTVDRDIAKAQEVAAVAARDINAACGAVNAAASFAAPFSAIPQVGSILMFATASCGSAVAVDALTVKAINDPSTVAWTRNLAAEIKALADRVRG